MDVRITRSALYCQISRSELDLLVSGRAIELQLQLPRHHVFRVSVRPSVMPADRGGWQLDSDPTGIWITVPRADLELLGQTKTFAERLMHAFPLSSTQSMQVVLEAIPDEDLNLDRSVLEIKPHADEASSQ